MWASAKLKLVDPRLTPLSSAGKIAVVSVDPKVIWFDETETSVKSFNDEAPLLIVVKLNVPDPLVCNTCPLVPSAVGKVNEAPLFNVLA